MKCIIVEHNAMFYDEHRVCLVLNEHITEYADYKLVLFNNKKVVAIQYSNYNFGRYYLYMSKDNDYFNKKKYGTK